jgi:hypothetical protein
MKWGRYVHGQLQEVVDQNPNDLFHSEIAQQFISVPDDTSVPVIVRELPNVELPRTWTIDSIRSKLTLSERVIWDNNSDPHVVTAKIEMAIPKEITETTAVLEMLLTANVISQSSMTAILA